MRIVDLHCDTILKLEGAKEPIELRKNNLNIDIEKLRKANSLAQFFAMFIYLKGEYDPMEKCLDMIDRLYIEIDKNKEDIALARNYDEVMENDRIGKLSAIITIEEGGAIKGKLQNLRNFYRLGVRLITLTWNYPNEIGYPSCMPEHMNAGLTAFGEEVVHEMNKLGMLIDVSHLSDGGFHDVARLSTKPFVASHSNARELCPHTRNLSEDMIKVLSNKGGVMGINFEREFLGNRDISTVEEMVNHIRHIRNVGGIDVISIGTDYDGINQQLEIENMGQISKLISGLQNNGFTDDEIEKIFYKNALRVIKDVLK
ncbi:MAG: peptidase [Clostridiales bacterium]|jgi:membrane dipeptidase|nr:peptidase [Clostridiales bacterium]